MSKSGLLADFLDIKPFADEVRRNPRTVRRWMDQVHDGLPYTWLGNRRMIHVPTAREWMFARMRNRNRGASSVRQVVPRRMSPAGGGAP